MGQSVIGSYDLYWAEYSKGNDEGREFLLNQIRPLLYRQPISIAIRLLEGAPGDVKKMLWSEWSTTVDLTGYTIDALLLALKTEPPDAVFQIIKTWLKVVDLSEYDLRGVLEIDKALSSKADKALLWERWAKHGDLTAIGMQTIAIGIKHLPPTIASTVYLAWVMVNNTSDYSSAQRRGVGSILPRSAIELADHYIGARYDLAVRLYPDVPPQRAVDLLIADRVVVNA